MIEGAMPVARRLRAEWLCLALLALAAARVQADQVPLPERNPLAERKPALAGVVTSGQDMPLPERRPEKPGKAAGEPKPAGDTAGEATKPEPPEEWTDAEVAAAKAECERLTKGLPIVFRYVPPIRHGECGTPQPVEVMSLGSGQKVELVPPAVMNCRMAAMLTRWLDTSVQPKAMALLGKPIARLSNASAYVCRNRYGAKDQKLSEHAKANAFDVSAFVTTDGRSIAVADHWGATMAEIEARKAAEAERLAKAATAAQLAQETKVASTAGAVPQGSVAVSTGSEDAGEAVPPPPEPKAKRIAKKRGRKQRAALGDLIKGEPVVAKGSVKDRKRRRGELIARPPELQPKTPEGKFLHAIHADACGIFGTVLGPEANAAHRDHLHLDLAARRRSNFCQ
jgi:hypothetical protein